MSTTKRWILAALICVSVVVLAVCGIGYLAFVNFPRAGLLDVAGDWCNTPTKLRLTPTGQVKVLTLGASWLSDQLGMDVLEAGKYGDNAEHGQTDLWPLTGKWQLEAHRRPAYLPSTPTKAHLSLDQHEFEFSTHADHDEWVLTADNGPAFRRCGLPG